MTTLVETADLVNRLAALDEKRRQTVEREIEAFEDSEPNSNPFAETRTILEQQSAALERLESLLESEESELEELQQATDHLSVDQAVRHRDQALAKLERRIDLLQSFRLHMSQAISTVESNLVAIERGDLPSDGSTGDEIAFHLQQAHAVLEEHNEMIDGLRRNLTILNAYLV
ncbi:hypothetical protein [Natronosalvus rutilus]|uniref:Uncharacterized protein n=1 Tax=Natronosalvus rutilus TaxID=2953753 RepID=A0A9E7NBD1_9EURY|nr:hypothetical protein [Natronosalvus rutilus]UTF54780.1 hypothetical protein NGM29_05800 [Natronosalvus rutilus]